MILLGHDKVVADWISKKVNKEFFGPYTTIGVLNRDGALIGGFVFNSHTGGSIEMSLAGRGVSRRSVWKAVLAYVFGQLKCSRLQIHTEIDNRIVKKLAPRLGFTFEGKMRNFYGVNHDALVYSFITKDLDNFKKRWRL